MEQGRQWAGSGLRISWLRWLGLQWSCWEGVLYEVSCLEDLEVCWQGAENLGLGRI